MKGPARGRRTPSASVVKLGGVPMAVAPWIVSDELWELVEPLLPVRERRFRYPGRKRVPDRQALQGILFVLHTGIAWQQLPPELGYGSGVTCWRRLDEWQQAGVWEQLHALLLARLRAAGEIEWSRAVADSSQVQAKKRAPRRARARSTGAARLQAPSPRRRHGNPARVRGHGRQPQRRHPTDPLLDRVPAVRGVVGRPRRRPDCLSPTAATTTTSTGGWSSAGSAGDRPPPDRARLRAGPPPLGRGAHLRLAAQFKRLRIRYERRADIHHAMLAIGCCLVCFRRLRSSSF